jgi:translocation and assembly module TamB
LLPNKFIRRLSYAFSVLLIIALAFFLLRGPYLSNSIKRAIQPVLENALGERIIIDTAVINLFPFYLQTKGFKVFDKNGNRLLWITKMRVYVDILGLLTRELRIRRLTVTEPDLSIDKEALENIAGYFAKKRKEQKEDTFGISIKNIKLTKGEFIISDREKQIDISGRGLSVGMIVKKAISAELSLEKGTFNLPDLQQLSAGISGKFSLEGKTLRILSTNIKSSGSTLEAKGDMQLSQEELAKGGNFSGKAHILMETIGRLFDLKETRDGKLSVSGSVNLLPERKSNKGDQQLGVELDLQTKGFFYLETLMELLKIKADVTGRLSIDGNMKGVYPRIVGSGLVKLKDAVLGTLSLDTVEGKIGYKDRKINLKNFIAHSYDGMFKGDASIDVSSGEYMVDGRGTDINSLKFFRFIRWEPPFPEGKISGPFTVTNKSGKPIDVSAEVTYTNPSRVAGTSFTDRLKTAVASIKFREDVLSISESQFATSSSYLFLDGDIDFNHNSMKLNLKLESEDVRDLTAPYFTGLQAPGLFIGVIEGAIPQPELSGDVTMGKGHINGESFSGIAGDVQYRPDLLSVRSLRMIQNKSVYETSGSITFRGATGLFSFKDPYFNGRAVITQGNAQSLLSAMYQKLPLQGSVDGTMFFKGDVKEFSGDADISITNGSAFGQPYDRAMINATLSREKFRFTKIEIQKNESKLNGEGSFYFNNNFDAKISSSRIKLTDLTIAEKYPVDGIFQLDMKGSGTVQNPLVNFSVKISESSFKDFPVGRGLVSGELKGKKLSMSGNFLEGTALADATMEISDILPWNVNVEFKKGRYDFLLAGFLKDIPKDLSASLEGSVVLKGKKKNVAMESNLSSLNFGLYGYQFNNKENIVIDLKDDVVEVKSFSLVGKNANINAGGTIKIGHEYDFVLYGRVNFTPLKAFSQSFESLNGDGDFIIEITGPWQSPELRGEINVKNATTMVAGLPNKIGPVNGIVFIDKNKVTFKSFNADFAGGRVILSGSGLLEGLALKEVLITSNIDDVRLKPLEEVDVTFDGELYLEYSPKRQSIVGDINIRRARYTKRVDWKSWILNLKKIKDAQFKKKHFASEALLNIHITGSDDIFVDNNIARTLVNINLNVQGTLSQYGLIGRAETKQGKVYFRNNEFTIIEGNVDFVELNRIVPVFNILAETSISGYRVTLNPLPDTVILTLLTAGHIGDEEKGIESGIGAGEATAFLTGQLQDVIEERFKYFTGFDRFEINPETTSTGAVSPRVTVGKRLLGQKLYVTYSTSLGTTEEDIIRLQFDLTRSLSLIGVRDEIGSLGGDVKYRYEFK